ncbi:adenylate/guanylate cyclase [Magnetococcus marinus MC-1]|uniref:Adenylate/guanylate cyclase n=1 Tax=Magnetococcus marinus (strain ATCC BAA-1437 / JCM 17883 / MC-1) TaxID=156889 RepID=A0L8S3_MAGMM|nr:adenylate/guanylate cyclase domain-containing protein [Magnetococcus marinus]ABK44366.1 adenylate/guanylate cyclase [Magnetococcus marinus MC-1]
MEKIKKTIWFRYAGSFLLVLIFLLLSLNIIPSTLFVQLDHQIYDTQLRTTMPGRLESQIVILDVDERSLARVGRWPWPRNQLAQLVNTLFDQYQINSLGFDFVFAEEDKAGGLEVLEHLATGPLKDFPLFQTTFAKLRPTLLHDTIFARALTDRPVVMGYYFKQRNDKGGQSGQLPPPLATLDKLEAQQFPGMQPESFGANLQILQNQAREGGFFDNPLVDQDGVFRRVPLLQVHNGGIYGSLALNLLRTALGTPTLSISPTGDAIWLDDGAFRIPVDRDMAVLVPYMGPQGSFPYISAADVLEGRVAQDKLEGRIVLMGTTAPGLLDLRSTPVQHVYPGVEIHANIIAGIMDGRIKSRPAEMFLIELSALLVLGILLTLLLPRLSPMLGTLLTASSLAAVVVATLLTWQKGMVMHVGLLLSLTILLYIYHMAYGFFVESRSKRQISKTFGQYIPSELVDEMTASGSDVSIGGESRTMTVLFSDVRSFTTISEGLKPDELTSLMNSFLTPMTRVIHENRGTIDKYMGDAIMAFWGAPLHDPEHTRHAVRSAFQMIEAMQALSVAFKAKGWPELKIGVGINTGTMNVGNMGSEFRMAYTVLGDAVNLGSRLEGLTKQYGVDIILGQGSKAEVVDLVCRELDLVRVKGKAEPIAIYEPVGFTSEVDEARLSELEQYHQALSLYRQQQWQEAEALLTALQTAEPSRMIYQIYLDRIAHFKVEPPDELWDGVFTHTSK